MTPSDKEVSEFDKAEYDLAARRILATQDPDILTKAGFEIENLIHKYSIMTFLVSLVGVLFLTCSKSSNYRLKAYLRIFIALTEIMTPEMKKDD